GRRGVALASRCKRQKRIAHRRHHSSRARSPLCELHAKLSEPDSARASRDPTYSQKDRTILIRTNLRRVVESERSLRCKSGGAAFSRTVPARHQLLNVQGNYQKPREDAQRTPKVPQLGHETEQGSSAIVDEARLESDAS